MSTHLANLRKVRPLWGWIISAVMLVGSGVVLATIMLIASSPTTAGAASRGHLGVSHSDNTHEYFAVANGDPINLVNPATLACDGRAHFDDLPFAGNPPGTNFDGILESGFVSFAERFSGQTRTTSGNFDILLGNPTSPLALQVGAPNQNISLVVVESGGSNVLTGLGPTGFPNFDSMGEGAFAALFDFDQSELTIDIVGGSDGTAVVNF